MGGTASRPRPCMTGSSITAFAALIGCVFAHPNGARPIGANDRYRGSRWRMRGKVQTSSRGRGRGAGDECLPPNHSPSSPLWAVLRPTSCSCWPASLCKSGKSALFVEPRLANRCDAPAYARPGFCEDVGAKAQRRQWARTCREWKDEGERAQRIMAGPGAGHTPLCRHASPFFEYTCCYIRVQPLINGRSARRCALWSRAAISLLCVFQIVG
ncbi:hypothetical protein B0T16DRAFT_65218 [Cercophora newfieldiana]|uniref:Secreted protein n=1 Tax=Cercophora newfieldiana TaxID=92897 RepID=A0AA39YT28_9PEZI|nr:hypothetical protein B0T16DRAFT_65218 [Cercophora newfieldiana]